MDVRFATFNASLYRSAAGQLASDLSTPDDAQAGAVAEIIQRARPDVLLLNEFDHDEDGRAIALFADNYLALPQDEAEPIAYPYSFAAASNTGIQTGHDLDKDGLVGGPDDAFGYGLFPGQYGMVVCSTFHIELTSVRTFQTFLWKDMPGNLMPTDFYTPAEQEILRLSSKSHWDVPIRAGDSTIHFLVSHPTPPVFDGPERRNARRNHDEIRFWADYISGAEAASYIYDDHGRRGGLAPGELFVIAGDQNADPLDGASMEGSIERLLRHPRIDSSVVPSSGGAVEASVRPGVAGIPGRRGDPAHHTADFSEPRGAIRVDYVLPCVELSILGGGVFWPVSSDPFSRLIGTFPFASSDHRLVWMDVHLPHRP